MSRTDVIAGAWRRRLSMASFATLLAALLVFVSTVPAYAYAYGTAILADSPSLYWPTDAGSGTTVSDSVGGHAGTMTSAGWSGSGMVVGSSDSMVGNNSRYVRDAVGGLSLGASVSMEVWYASTSSTTNQSLMQIIQHPESATCPDGGQGFVNSLQVIINGGAGKVRVDDFCAGTAQYAADCSVSTSTEFDGAPHYVAVTRTSGATKLYFDGALCGSTGGNSATFSALDAGCPSIGAGCFSGAQPILSSTRVGQYALYPFVLTATQVANHYAARAGAPPSYLYVVPHTTTMLQGFTVPFTLSSADATYNDTTGSDTFTVFSITPSSGLTCTSFISNTVNCTVTTVGSYSIVFHDAFGLSATATVNGSPNPNAFTISPVNVNAVTGEKVRFDSFATNAAGENISLADGFTVTTLAHQSCGAPGIDTAAQDWRVFCTYDTAGTYTFTARDLFGRPATATVYVATAVSTAACTTDIAGVTCVLSQIWDSIKGLLAIPGQVIGSLRTLLFVSQSGKSYLDTSSITSTALLPAVDCRSGQTPTAPDGIHCLPFPFSIPYDAAAIVNVINVSPTAPSFTLTWDFHFLGSTIHATHDFDVSSLLTDTMMGYVRGAELVIFILGTAFGTWRIVQMTGAA